VNRYNRGCFLEHFFAFPSTDAGEHVGGPRDHRFTLALSLDATTETSGGPKSVSFLPKKGAFFHMHVRL
jgi:hypothetical protein